VQSRFGRIQPHAVHADIRWAHIRTPVAHFDVLPYLHA
jgi:hypothetical protein